MNWQNNVMKNNKKNGRTHICRLNTESLSQATEWLSFYEKFWTNRFGLLENELLKAKKKEH
jgi:hypothetical protein